MRSLMVALLLISTAAHADRVVLSGFDAIGKIAAPQRKNLRASVVEGLRAAGFEIVSDEEVARALKSAPQLTGCGTPACVRRIGELTHAGYVVQGSIEALGSSNYVYVLQLLDAEDGQPAARVEDHCDVCSLADTQQALNHAAAQLKPPKPPGEAAKIAQPTPPPPAPAPPPKPRRPLRIAAVALAVVGIPVLAAGVGLWAVDGKAHSYQVRNDPSTGMPDGQIQRWDTLAAGVALTTVGIAMVGAAIGLFTYDELSHRSKRVALNVGPRQAALSVAF